MRLLANPTLRLFIGAALISLSPVWVKLVDVSATSSAFWRVAIGGTVLAVYLLITRRRLQFSSGLWGILGLAAFQAGVDQPCTDQGDRSHLTTDRGTAWHNCAL